MRWYRGARVAWLPDGTGLVSSCAGKDRSTLSGLDDRVPFAGQARRLTKLTCSIT